MKKLIAFIAFILPLVFLYQFVFGATYYVDCNADGDAGAGTGTGAAVAWKTINKVNTSSFSAGDSILFNKGCTWREQLTVPSSGSAGHPFTIGAYGTGEKPVISGANLVTTWAEDPLAASATDTFETGSVSAWWSSSGVAVSDAVSHAGTYSALHNSDNDNLQKTSGLDLSYLYLEYYMRISSTSSPGSGHQTRWMDIKLPHPYYVCGWLWYTSSQYRLGADASLTVLPGAGQYAVLSTNTWYKIGLTINISAKTYLLTVDGTTVSNGSIDSSSTDVDAIIVGSNGWNTTSFVVNTDDYNIYNVDPSGSSNIWYATLDGGTETKTVAYNRVKGSVVANKAAVTGAGKWFHDTANDRLYLYSTSDPDSAYISPGVEAGSRNQSVVVSSKDYITMTDLSLFSANSSTEAGVQLTGFANGIMNNCTVGFNAYTGVFAGAASDSAQFINNEFSYNGSIGLDIDSSDDVIVSGGSSHHNSGAGGSGYYIGALTPTSDDCTIMGVTAYSNAAHGITVDNATGINLTGNTIYSNTYNGIYVPTNATATISRNTIYSNGDRGILIRKTSGDAVTVGANYNLIYSNTTDGIYIYEGATGTAYNNTLYGNTRSGLKAETAGTTFTAKNNILSTNTRYGYEADGNVTQTLDHNSFYGNVLGGAVNFILGATDLTADPKLRSASNFHLLPHSPAIDAGVSVSLTSDYSGAKVPQRSAPSIGAYEYIRKIIGHRIMPGITP